MGVGSSFSLPLPVFPISAHDLLSSQELETLIVL